MRKGIKISLIVIVIIIFAVLIYYYYTRPAALQEPEYKGVQVGKAIPVKVTIAQRDTLIHYVNTEGRAGSRKSWKAIAEVGGTVEKILHGNGEYVEQGDLILQLKNETLEQQLISSSIKYQKKYAAYLSLKQVIPDKFTDYDVELSEYIERSQNYDQYERHLEELLQHDSENPGKYISLKEAGADLEALFAQYKKLNFYAPFAGIIGNMDLKVNNYISVKTHLFDLNDTREMEVIVPVMETDIQYLKIGEDAYLKFLAYPDEFIQGKIAGIDALIDETSQLASVKVYFDNPNNKISVGMFGECYLCGQKEEEVLLVPSMAVLTRDDRELVFTKEDDHSYWRYVKTGNNNGYYTEIIEGIHPGDSVIVDRHYTLIHGAEVIVSEVIPLESFSLTESEE